MIFFEIYLAMGLFLASVIWYQMTTTPGAASTIDTMLAESDAPRGLIMFCFFVFILIAWPSVLLDIMSSIR